MKDNKPRDVRLERVENVAQPGMPDVHGISRGVTCWIELKTAERPARVTTALVKKADMRRDQVAWHTSYTSAGGRSAILVRDNHRQLYVFNGALAARIHMIPYSECVVLHGVASWPETFEWFFK